MELELMACDLLTSNNHSLKHKLGEDYKHLKPIYQVLDNIKQKGIDLGILGNEEADEKGSFDLKVGFRGEEKDFILEELILQSLEIKAQMKNKMCIGTVEGKAALIIDEFGEFGYTLSMAWNKEWGDYLAININNRPYPFLLIIAAISGKGFMDDKKEIKEDVKEGVLVNHKVNTRYQELLSDYCIGDFKDMEGFVIVMSKDGGKNLEHIDAKAYFDIYTKIEGNHKVFDIYKEAANGPFMANCKLN